MGGVNSPSNLLDRIKRLEQRVTEAFKKNVLSSARIDRGGLTLENDAFFRMVDNLGIEIVYFGPDNLGRQIIRIRREGGGDVMWTGFTLGGRQFWRLTDRFNRECFSDDTESGGIARPWLPVLMYPLFSMAASTVYGYQNLAVSAITTETTLWEGRIPLVSHPRLSITGIWGQATGTNTSTYNLYVSGNLIGTWTPGFENSTKGPFNIAPYLDQLNATVQLKVSATGTGLVAAQVFGCYLRQTP